MQRDYSSKLLMMTREHEDLEERQQALLEELGRSLSTAMQSERFWKQAVGQVGPMLNIIDRPC
jgi:hypothetical protein